MAPQPFQLGWSRQFPTGEPVPLHYFGTDLVAYRGESGTVRLFDAHCPHLGAHLGFGGEVRGDDLVCPFHGWRYDGETGANVEIPYSARTCFPKVSLRSWSVDEHCGVVYFWHDANGLDPQWPAPRPIESLEDFFPTHPEGERTWKLQLFPQFIPDGDPVLVPTVTMATIIVLMDLVYFTFLAVVVSRARRAIVERGWARKMEAASGSVLMALGVRLALISR